ncbi:MAG: DUF4038 domain-containing protein [Clostridia bacterium]|nr:DUF4038 domain-containing protein [Clostridia bacterium]
MKKFTKIFFALILCLSMMLSFVGCNNNPSNEDNSATPSANNGTVENSGGSAEGTNTPSIDSTDTPAQTPDISATVTPTPAPDGTINGIVWRVTELKFKSTKKYIAAKGEGAEVVFDGIFTHKATGETLTIPGFWDGSADFKLRFAPTKEGLWEYKTVCASDPDLNGKTGHINAVKYTGNLEIYKRGFVKSTIGTKYFTYADGTPFFYLGDTHWSMLSEEFDSAGPNAGSVKTDSHFKYIVDKRVAQGYTVYQSEPFPGDLTDGKIQRIDVEAFQKADKYFEYIADNGLVHAHAQLFFPTYTSQIADNKEALKMLSRYWVARYGAYPVMWTLSQEIDNDFYYENGNQSHIKYNDNFWLDVAEYINKYDAYDHPLSGHQENAYQTCVNGSSSNYPTICNGAKSLFLDEAVSQRTGHSWWAAQWFIEFNNPKHMFRVAEEYWQTKKVAIMYEGKYEYLMTMEQGARAQGWVAFLNGCFGYGYGIGDIWNYKGNSYLGNVTSNDGRDTITPADRNVIWGDTVEAKSGYQAGYMKQFLQKISWWKLVPDFDYQKRFKASSGWQYACATIDNSTYVVYLFNDNTSSGTFVGMNASATYTVKWYNPRTNEYQTVSTNMKPSGTSYTLPAKPDSQDWVLIAVKN